MSFKRSVSLTALSVNWQLFALFLAGIMMLGGALFIAHTSARIHFAPQQNAVSVVAVPHYAQRQDNIGRIRHLFQPATTPVAADQLRDEISSDDAALFNAPASTLPVEITGIISASQPEHSLLIVGIQGRQYSLSAGERLPDSEADVVRIFPDRAIIRHHGKYAALIMAE